MSEYKFEIGQAVYLDNFVTGVIANRSFADGISDEPYYIVAKDTDGQGRVARESSLTARITHHPVDMLFPVTVGKSDLYSKLIRKLEVGEMFKSKQTIFFNGDEWLTVTKVTEFLAGTSSEASYTYTAVDEHGEDIPGGWEESHINIYETNLHLIETTDMRIKKTTPNLPTI